MKEIVCFSKCFILMRTVFRSQRKTSLNFISNITRLTSWELLKLFPKRSYFKNQELFYHIENYDMFLSDINEGRGVAIYIKKSLNAVALTVESSFNESLWCKIQLQNQDSLLIGCLYRSPNANDENISSS